MGQTPESSSYQLSPGMWARLGYQVFDEEDALVETGESELCCLIGYGVLFPALEEKLEGLAQGSQRTVLLRPEQAFGVRNPEAQVEVDRADFPEDVAAGDCYEAEDEDGRPVLLQVLDVSEEGGGGRQQPPARRANPAFRGRGPGGPPGDRRGAGAGRTASSDRRSRAQNH